MSDNPSSPQGLFAPGINCRKVAKANHASVIIDGEEYFANLLQALEHAENQIVFIGWDFDTRVSMRGGEEGPSLRKFIVGLLRKKKSLRIYMLKWNFGALKILLRGRMIITILRWMISNRLRIKFDGMHPIGASHHQKLVVIDGSLAFCGGIDATSGRWDTRDHVDSDPKRISPNGDQAEPWHDLSMVFDGPAAEQVHEIASERWQKATGKALPKTSRVVTWPFGESTFENVGIALARTRGEYGETDSIRESEALFLDMIASARHFLYAENQYFASRTIAAAIAHRLQEDNPPEFVIIMPEKASGWLEQVAMDTARSQLVAMIQKLDSKRRFRIYHPFTKGGKSIYVHAKLTIVDDRIIRIGSSNMNNRSMGFDSECDAAIDAEATGGEPVSAKIKAIRESLLGEHLDHDPDKIASMIGEGSIIDVIENLRNNGRSLRPYKLEESDDLAEFVASQNLLDPVGEDQQELESMTARKKWSDRIRSSMGMGK